MLVLGIVFFIIGLALMALFPTFMTFSPDRFVILLYVLLMALPFGLGLFSIIVVKKRDVVTAFIAFFIWSLVLLVPVPQGYGEPIYGGSLILMVGTILLIDKYKKSKKKDANLGKKIGEK
jgi:hypothetical protein